MWNFESIPLRWFAPLMSLACSTIAVAFVWWRRNQPIEYLILEFALVALVLFLLSMIFFLRLSWRAGRIVEVTRRLAAGDWQSRSEVAGTDELGQIGIAIDQLAMQLSESSRRNQESERRLEAIVSTAVDAIITIDERGTIDFANAAAERLFGYSRDELVGHNVRLLMPSPFREEHDAYLANYLRTGDRKVIGIGREVIGRRKDGSEFPIQLAVSEVRIGERRLFTGVLHDITDRKQSEQELRRLNEQLEHRVSERTMELEVAQAELVRQEKLATLGQLAGSVAHEIRNPLAVIKNATYYLQTAQTNADQESKEAYDEIERSLATSNRIISELLDYARDPKRLEATFSVDTLVDRAIALLTIPSTIRVDRQDRQAPMNVQADPGHVERILVNLIQNAIQAMPIGGTLTIRCYSPMPGKTCVEVSDVGVGIAPEDLPRVFEPLFSRKAKGIGLGLALSRRYAELNRGELQAESQLGQGATFRLILPNG